MKKYNMANLLATALLSSSVLLSGCTVIPEAENTSPPSGNDIPAPLTQAPVANKPPPATPPPPKKRPNHQ